MLVLTTVVFSSLVFSVSLVLAEETKETQVPVIGFIGGFSGPGRTFGEACRNGFEMGRSSAGSQNIKVIYEDDQFLPQKTVTAFKKLTEIDQAKFVIVLGSSPANSIAQMAEQKKVALFAWASDPAVASKRRHVVRTWVSGDREGERMADEATRRGYNDVGFIIATDDYARSVNLGFRDHFKKPLLLNEEYPRDMYDFVPFLLKAKARGVKQLGISLHPGQSSALARQAKNLKLELAFFGDENLHRREEVLSSQGALEGAWFVTGNVSDEFREKYVAEFQRDDVISGAALHYDLAHLFSKAIKADMTPDQFMNKLFMLGQQQGALGDYRFVRTSDDQFLDLGLVVREISRKGFK